MGWEGASAKPASAQSQQVGPTKEEIKKRKQLERRRERGRMKKLGEAKRGRADEELRQRIIEHDTSAQQRIAELELEVGEMNSAANELTQSSKRKHQTHNNIVFPSTYHHRT